MMRLCSPRLSVVLVCLATAACTSDPEEGASSTGMTAEGSTSTPDTSSTAGPTTDPSSSSTTVLPGSEGGESTAGATSGADTGGETGSVLPKGTPPPNADELVPWLEAGTYADWAAEGEIHPSAGPHFSGVRTFVNDTLFDSLEMGADEHPVGSAAVKELYDAGQTLGGWAVIVKVAPGDTNDTWYWYEGFEGTTYADERGNGGCGNCHGLGVDFVWTDLPL